MRAVNATEFKTKCLSLMDRVASTGESLLVTKNGKPVVELRLAAVSAPRSPLGLHKGKIKELADIMEPLDVEAWEALK